MTVELVKIVRYFRQNYTDGYCSGFALLVALLIMTGSASAMESGTTTAAPIMRQRYPWLYTLYKDTTALAIYNERQVIGFWLCLQKVLALLERRFGFACRNLYSAAYIFLLRYLYIFRRVHRYFSASAYRANALGLADKWTCTRLRQPVGLNAKP